MSKNKGWKNESARHSMAARGVMTQDETQLQLRKIQEAKDEIIRQKAAELSQFASREEALKKQLEMFAKIKSIDSYMKRTIEEAIKENMYEVPLDEDEYWHAFRSLDSIEEFVDEEYSGDWEGFVFDYGEMIKEEQQHFDIEDNMDYKDAIKFINKNKDRKEDFEIFQEDNEDKMSPKDLLNKYFKEYLSYEGYEELLFEEIYRSKADYMIENSQFALEIVEDDMRANDHRVDYDNLTNYAIMNDMRDLHDPRWALDKEQLQDIKLEALDKYKMTEKEYVEYAKLMTGTQYLESKGIMDSMIMSVFNYALPKFMGDGEEEKK